MPKRHTAIGRSWFPPQAVYFRAHAFHHYTLLPPGITAYSKHQNSKTKRFLPPPCFAMISPLFSALLRISKEIRKKKKLAKFLYGNRNVFITASRVGVLLIKNLKRKGRGWEIHTQTRSRSGKTVAEPFMMSHDARSPRPPAVRGPVGRATWECAQQSWEPLCIHELNLESQTGTGPVAVFLKLLRSLSTHRRKPALTLPDPINTSQLSLSQLTV